MIISRTPVALSFFGGAADYGEHCGQGCSVVMGTTINKFTYVSVSKLSRFFKYRIRIGYSEAKLVHSVEEIAHPGMRETLKFKNGHSNLDIHIFADPPAKMGLGFSSSFTVGLLNALYGLDGKHISKRQLAEEAACIEQRLAGENIGWRDQSYCAFGGFNIIEHKPSGVSMRPVAISSEKHRHLNDCLMVFRTGPAGHASEYPWKRVQGAKESESGEAARQISRMVFEAERIISDGGPEEMAKGLGSLLHETRRRKKCLSTQVAIRYIDEMYDAAVGAGAYGGKFAGVGNGGYLFLLAPPEKKQKIREALGGLAEVAIKFESEGSKIIYPA